VAERRAKCEEGLPPWLATFADLMSLLMCFFVLLLSFSEIDAIRFRKMAESMKDAFGVQREVPAIEIVKGISVIKQEFSPAVSPDPALVDELRQETEDEDREELKVNEEVMEAVESKLREELREHARALERTLEEEIAEGLVEVETQYPRIVVRIRERGSFASGSDQLDPEFLSVMEKISAKLADVPGRIVTAGHTDDVPISTSRFRSNWELSAARAVTVTHALLTNPRVDPLRVVVEGYADTRPLVPNDSPENRAKNRRVELILARDEGEREWPGQGLDPLGPDDPGAGRGTVADPLREGAPKP
jgi:chemotaxis protein MotB